MIPFFRLLISMLFLFSGLVKLNDLIGFSLKIEAYLHAFALDLGSIFLQLVPYSVPLAMGVCLLEVILGMALLLKFQTRFILRALSVLTWSFTVLTLYTLWFKRVDSCGCLSDAIPLTAQQSFIKNILLLLILHLFHKHSTCSTNNFSLVTNLVGLLLTGVGGAFIGWYSLNKLPIIDFGPYQIGMHIPQLIKPSNSLQWLETDQEIKENITYPLDSTYQVLKTESLNPTAKPLITNFIIWDAVHEITQEVLVGIKLICIVQHPAKLDERLQTLLIEFVQQILSPVAVLWLLPFQEDKESLPASVQSRVVWGSADLLRAMIRTDIGFMLLQNGVVLGKWAYKDLPKAQKDLAKLGFYQLPT